MAKLNKSDMTSEASHGPYAGINRADIFDKKIKDGKTFRHESETGKEVTGVSYDKKAEILYWTKGNKTGSTKRSQIFKDSDFGGGASGSGGGSNDTEITESLQCYYCSYIFNSPVAKITNVSDADLAKCAKYVHASMSLKKCLKNIPAGWRTDKRDIFADTANKIYQKYSSKTSGIVYFHRGSTFMNNVYKAKQACHKKDKKLEDTQAPGSFSNDKWNPGDIWMTTYSPSETPLSDFTSSWGELNNKVAELAGAYSVTDKTKLLGISLKKLAANATIKEFKKPGQNSVKDYTFTGYSFGQTGDFFSSKDLYLNSSAGQIQFRTFNNTTAWQGEIKGTSAALGKIGGKNVDFYTKKIMGEGFLPSSGEAGLFKETERDDFPQKLYEMYKDTNQGSSPRKSLLSFSDFMSEYEKKPQGWKNSKLACMKFLLAFTSGNKKQKDALINSIFLYGSSDTDQSSHFIVVK